LPPVSTPTASTADLQALHDELRLLSAPDVHPVLESLFQTGKALSEPGFELEGVQGEIIATAELAWPTEQIAVLVPDQQEDVAVFEAHHWTVLSAEACVSDPDLLLSKLPDINV